MNTKGKLLVLIIKLSFIYNHDLNKKVKKRIC